MDDRTLESLGLAEAPREHPLGYPGVWPADSGLLDGDRLLPLERLVHPDRVPVLAVGSNACPGQLRHKMAESGIGSPLPLTRARVTGLDVGVSAHVSVMGYLSASPFVSPGTVRELFVTWFDAEQLAVVDASEGVPVPDGHYLRVWLPGSEVRIELADGTVLPGAFGYVNRRGVLVDRTGGPRPHLRDQRALLSGLLLESPGLRALFGYTAEEFSRRARGDLALCEAGTRLFAEEKLVTASGLERFAGAPAPDEPPSSPLV